MSSYSYQKFVYWQDESAFDALKTNIIADGVSLTETKKAVCSPLSKRVDLGYVLPSTWGRFELCKRQLSWYRKSIYYGKILLVSSFDLDEYGMRYDVLIRQSVFKPPSLPSEEEKAELVERLSYKRARPEEWDDIASLDDEENERRLNVMGLRGVKFEELFVSHCANHANFIEPAYFILEKDERVPYSICKTSHICSACMEWYNIVGCSFGKKLVVPCPGAVLFAGLITNRYYEVTHWRPNAGDDEDPA
ncbi:MAG: hypothetical protein NTY51_11840 [Deltaproteobacteria bacterium]|nr:hypothetical protein [Deltaproteobacteria bacterium]